MSIDVYKHTLTFTHILHTRHKTYTLVYTVEYWTAYKYTVHTSNNVN